MCIHVIKMPDIGEGIAEVELVAWRVKPGEWVVEDQTLADVMTEKATVEVPSPVAGKVLVLNGEPGEVKAVGSELIRIEVEGAESVDVGPLAATDRELEDTALKDTAGPPHAAAAPTAEPSRAPSAAPAAAPMPPPPGDRPIASPAVRRRAWELGIELRDVSGSGTAGRITHADLDACAARSDDSTAAPRASIAAYAQRHDEQAQPVIGLRRQIAQKMRESKRRIPHFTYVEEVDVTELDALRARLNESWGATRGHLSVLPFVMRAMVLALREFPQINARYDDEAGIVTRYGAVHAGIATQTQDGLMVPVVRHAEGRDLWSCAAEIARLAAAARAGRAAREELSGSTITITSMGAAGGLLSTPVINHPEVAIVGVNRIALRPVIRGGAVVARQMMNLSSSFDHRVIDGVHAAGFVQSLRGFLECPAMLFVQ